MAAQNGHSGSRIVWKSRSVSRPLEMFTEPSSMPHLQPAVEGEKGACERGMGVGGPDRDAPQDFHCRFQVGGLCEVLTPKNRLCCLE